MLNPKLLRSEFGTESVAIANSDPRLKHVIELKDSGQYLEAAEAAAELIREHHHHVQIVTVWMFGLFWQDGFSGLLQMIELLDILMRERKDFLGPEKNREVAIAKSLEWMFALMGDRMDHAVELSKTNIPDPALVGETLPARVASTIELLGDSPVHEKCVLLLWKIEGKLRAFKPAAAATKEEPVPDETSPPKPAPTPAAPVHRESPQSGDRVLVEGSREMQILLRKLDAFRQLVEEGEYTKAAVVADDLDHNIENFDPRVFLPSLFTTYYRLMSTNVSAIQGARHDREGALWSVLQELYRVDLDAFVEES